MMIAGVDARYPLLSPLRNRGLPRLRFLKLRKSVRPDLRWGRGGEGGTKNTCARCLPPFLSLLHKGGGNGQSGALRFMANT